MLTYKNERKRLWNSTDNPKRRQFDREILTALNEYAKVKQTNRDGLEK